MTGTAVERRLRRFCRLLSVILASGAVVELWLVGHTAGLLQWLPFLLCGAIAMSLILVWVRPTSASIMTHRIVMVLVLLGAAYGTCVHVLYNMRFAREIRPNAPTAEIRIAGVRGANPPLAPGILATAAALGLAGVAGLPARGLGSRAWGLR